VVLQKRVLPVPEDYFQDVALVFYVIYCKRERQRECKHVWWTLHSPLLDVVITSRTINIIFIVIELYLDEILFIFRRRESTSLNPIIAINSLD